MPKVPQKVKQIPSLCQKMQTFDLGMNADLRGLPGAWQMFRHAAQIAVKLR